MALADGISSSAVSHIASAWAVTSFLEDYYCTSEAWSVKTSAERVLSATNSWLHAQSSHSPHRYDKDKGYVCTLSAVILKARTAHLFHVGDSRIYRLCNNALEQLTRDHRVWLSADQSHLSRALGIEPQLEIDYQALQVEVGDIFLLTTDGVHEYAEADVIVRTIVEHRDDLDRAARLIVEHAYARGSSDNLTLQILRIDALAPQAASEVLQEFTRLPLPPLLDARMEFDGYKIVKQVHASSRSHIYLATDNETGALTILKVPSIDLRDDPAYLERFMMEEWIARRIDSAHVLKPCSRTRKPQFLYVAMEYIHGQTLAQWMRDHPTPSLETVRGIVEQIARGLRAFHRMEMLHQDLRPENIMIDSTGTVKIIDFGSTRVAGIEERAVPGGHSELLGTPQYTAPEYFVGEPGTSRGDLFSLGVITYQMLTGALPYGAEVAKCTSRAEQNRLIYHSALEKNRAIPAWIDGVLRQAVQPNPAKRYQELSEFTYDLRHPNAAFLKRTRAPLLERNPVAFWRALSVALMVVVLVLLVLRRG